MADTVRTVAYMLASLFEDGQAPGSISPQFVRDFVVTMAAMAGIGSALTTASAAGTTQGTATALTTYNTVVNGGTGGVQIMSTQFVIQRVFNRSGVAIQVYPTTSVAIETLAANAGVTLANGGNMEVVLTTSTQAYIVGGAGAPQLNMPTSITGLSAGNTWRNGNIVEII